MEVTQDHPVSRIYNARVTIHNGIFAQFDAAGSTINNSLVVVEVVFVDAFDDLYSTGFFDDLESGAVLVVEWSETVAGFLPEGGVRIDIRQTGETDREITAEGGPFG